jgi:hypothetical protein
VILTLLVALVSVGCGSADPDGSSSSTAPGDTTAVTSPLPPTYSDPSKPITVALGSEFALALRADPRSGLSWQPVNPPNPVVLLSIGSLFRSVGRAGQVEQVLLYGGRGPGISAIQLRYGQSKAGSPALQTVTFVVTVVDPNAPPPPPPTTTTTTTKGAKGTTPTA